VSLAEGLRRAGCVGDLYGSDMRRLPEQGVVALLDDGGRETRVLRDGEHGLLPFKSPCRADITKIRRLRALR
jgi:hypothetical protein